MMFRKKIAARQLIERNYDQDGKVLSERVLVRDVDYQDARIKWADTIMWCILEDQCEEAFRDPDGFAEKVFSLADAMIEHARK